MGCCYIPRGRHVFFIMMDVILALVTMSGMSRNKRLITLKTYIQTPTYDEVDPLENFTPGWSDEPTDVVSVGLVIIFYALWTGAWNTYRWVKLLNNGYSPIPADATTKFPTQTARWFDYAISSPVITILIVLYGGIFDTYTVIGLCALDCCTIVIGALAERLSTDFERRVGTLLAFVPFIIVHTIIWIQFKRLDSDYVPDFVAYIVMSIIIAKALFGIIQLTRVFYLLPYAWAIVLNDWVSELCKQYLGWTLVSRVIFV